MKIRHNGKTTCIILDFLGGTDKSLCGITWNNCSYEAGTLCVEAHKATCPNCNKIFRWAKNLGRECRGNRRGKCL